MITDFLLKLDTVQLVALFFLVIGFVILALSSFAILSSISSKKWVTTNGRVINSEFYKSQFFEETHATYRPNITFEYTVNGEKFVSDRLYYGVKIMSSGNWVSTRKLIEKYPINTVITVYYNPNKPKEAIIEPGVHFDLGAIFILSIFFVTLGLIIYLNSDFVTT